MKIPGFTAETSLFKTSQSYHVARTLGQTAAAIRPAVIRDPDCVSACVDRCADSSSPQACFNHCFRRCPVLVFEPLP
jgi:hypothetical protein